MMDKTLSLEPIFCKHTGAYLPHVAHFCSTILTPVSSFELCSPAHPSELDTFSWHQQNLEKYEFKIHPQVAIHYGVRSILKRKSENVTLLVNKDMGSFIELANDFKLVEIFKPLEFLRYLPNLEECNASFTLVSLLRHRLLSTDTNEECYNVKNTGYYALENFLSFFPENEHYIVRSDLSGKMFRFEREFFDLI